MLGYWKNEQATAQVLSTTGWLNTGDRARMENGFLYITGRIKEIIVLGNGEKVPPVDMELAIQLDPAFEQVMVVGEGKPYLGALVVLSGSASKGPVDEKELTARVAKLVKGFPGYAQIRRIAIVPERWTVENGLLTPTLKLKRDPIVAKHQDLIDQIYKGH